MNNKRTLEQDYKNLKRLETPDLWSRIEKDLNERPDRRQNASGQDLLSPNPPARRRHALSPTSRIPRPAASRIAAAAAAGVILITAAAPWKKPGPLSGHSASRENAVITAETTMASADRDAEGQAGQAQETMAFQEEDQAAAFGPSSQAETPPAGRPGVVSYSQLSLTDHAPLTVPAQARTMPEDAQYFSQDMLKGTELLCQATVIEARLETDQDGVPWAVSYQILLDQIYYSQDYVDASSYLTVTAPIIEAQSDPGAQSHVLYQLQPGASYLLPLTRRDQNWHLLCAFAPQVRITADGEYLFHSGYTTLVNHQTAIVIGSQEGANDYYYDKMLLRDDDGFLGDFIALTKTSLQ
ncbi:MAG: hypothetical protein HFG71_14940 [Hungatella sp.]|jgi:hypothetical protein|nr:hypothetical protein [Hungatella sp.]